MVIDNPLGITETSYIVIECLHITGFVVVVGMNAIVDLRLLGLALPGQSADQLTTESLWWISGGLLVSVFTGLLLFSTDPDMYYANLSFLFKMACLCLAIALTYSAHRKAAKGKSQFYRRAVGAISLVLWVSAIFGGIFIAGDILRTIGSI
jgi:predicted cobalt transporter CbtA